MIDKKINALHAHTSQMYEWLPWVNGTLDDVPEGNEARREWLDRRVKSRKLTSERRKSLEKWYGAKVSDIKWGEAFEIAEYGFQPDDEEIRKYFPMLGK